MCSGFSLRFFSRFAIVPTDHCTDLSPLTAMPALPVILLMSGLLLPLSSRLLYQARSLVEVLQPFASTTIYCLARCPPSLSLISNPDFNSFIIYYMVGSHVVALIISCPSFLHYNSSSPLTIITGPSVLVNCMVSVIAAQFICYRHRIITCRHILANPPS